MNYLIQIENLIMKNENRSSKSPRKPITEIEKQRRELNKLKGENLEECLNKHREAVKFTI